MTYGVATGCVKSEQGNNAGIACYYNIILLFIMLISGFYHGYLGIQTICIDYIPNQRSRVSIVFMVGAMFSILSVFGIFSLIQLVTA